MKKLFLSMLCLALIICPIQILAENKRPHLIENNIVKSDTSFEMCFQIDNLEYFPFIYSTEKGEIWFMDEVVGPAECEEGYLYSKDLETNTIRQLVDVPVESIWNTNDYVYFLYDNSIYEVDNNGNSLRLIVESKEEISEIFSVLDNDLYYVIKGNLYKINLTTLEANSLFEVGNVSSVYVKSEDEIIYIENDNVHQLRVSSRMDRIVEDEYEIERLYVMDQQEEDTTLLLSSSLTDPNLLAVTSGHALGSYFSDNATTGCTCHNSGCSYWGGCDCISYLGDIQCMGYAYWASDTYAHRTGGSNITADIYDVDTVIDTTAKAQAYFARASVGAYVRICRYSDYSYGHSLFVVSVGSSSVNTYECNLDGKCGIVANSRSYSSFASYYRYGVRILSHHYGSSYAQYNSAYHLQYCTSSGCGGYRLVAHYSLTDNNTCSACGYVGNF